MNWPEIPSSLDHALSLYRDELAMAITVLNDCLQTWNAENQKRAQEIVHRLRGSSGFFGFSEIVSLCEQAEKELQKNTIPLSRLAKELPPFHAALTQRYFRLAPGASIHSDGA